MKRERIKHMVYHGPPDDGGTLAWMLGMWLWWRIWAFMAVTFGGLIATLFIADAVMNRWDVGSAILVTFFAGYLIGEWSTKISPKYNVTKNY